MIIAVNMKDYRFGKLANITYSGFGLLDTATGLFVSHDGRRPYVLNSKHTIAAMAAELAPIFGRVAHS